MISVTMLVIWLLLVGASFQDSEQVDSQALEWFFKGQELTGTKLEYSREQAEFFEKAVELDPDFVEARYNLAVIYIQQSRSDAALQQLNAWIDLEPEDPRGYLLRARLRMEEDRLDGAAQDFQQALTLDAGNHEAWQWLGRIHYRQGQYQEADLAFHQVLKLSPGSAATYFDLALVLHALARKEEAIDHYRKFLNHFPDDFQANYRLGLIYRETGQDDLALKHFLRAEEKEPDQWDLLEQLGNLYLDRDNLGEARARLLRADQESVFNLANLGVIAKREGQNGLALQYFDRALHGEPHNAQIWAHQGDVLAQMERNQEAVEAYQNSLRYNPEDLNTLYNLGTLYVYQKRPREALDLFQGGLTREPCHGQLHHATAVVLDQMQDSDRAETHYRRSIDCGAQEPFAHLRLAFLLARKGNRTEALYHLTAALEERPEEYVTVVVTELRKVHSDLDSIRYTDDFRRLLSKYQARSNSQEPAIP